MNKMNTLALILVVALFGKANMQPINKNNYKAAEVIFNTIHDGYHSQFLSAVWIFQKKFIVFQSCKEQVLESVQNQFINVVAARVTKDIYVVPLFVFDPEINVNETPETSQIIFSVDRKFGTGLVVRIDIARDGTEEQQEWVNSVQSLGETIPDLKHFFGTAEIQEVSTNTEFLAKANLCKNILAAKQKQGDL